MVVHKENPKFMLQKDPNNVFNIDTPLLPLTLIPIYNFMKKLSLPKIHWE